MNRKVAGPRPVMYVPPRPRFTDFGPGATHHVDPDELAVILSAAGLKVSMVAFDKDGDRDVWGVREDGSGAWFIVGIDGGVYRVHGGEAPPQEDEA
jgi:hypothetical protein